jgi:aminomethyltransferase
LKLTPLYNVHLSLGAKMFTTASGYQMPSYYTKVEEEHRAVRDRVGMIDLSLMGRIDIKGKEALGLVQVLAVNDASKLTDGRAMYSTFCNELGNIVDDVTVWRFSAEHFRVVTSSVMRQRSLKWIRENVQDRMVAYVTDISSSLGCIAVQGPRSQDTLRKICDADLTQLRFFRFIPAKLAGIPGIIARVGFTGELGFECYFGAEETVQAWNAIAEAGKEYGILPYGLDVLDTLRYEKGFIFFGYEVTHKNNPFECGLDRWIRFDKPSFLGKEALLAIKRNGPKRKLVGLEVASGEPIQPLMDVKSEGEKIGETLLGFRGLTVGKNIGWAFVDTRHAEFGNKVKVTGKEKETDATIVDICYYDPTGARMKM